ncbi:MAG: NAD(P)H-dependent oxidoreductase [Treponema sp.]|nr:NAD(P)H-dependent oxidoreductase [Treponema sp.]
MKVFIVYAHPSEDSLTRHVRDAFIAGLESAGHSYLVSDLYKMNFKTDMTEEEYRREAFYRGDIPVPDDVQAEQDKINSSGAIVFIFPLFWSDAPAKMVGWFDRVWTYGFAYGDASVAGADNVAARAAVSSVAPSGVALNSAGRTMKQLEKGLVLCVAGNTMEYFHETGILGALEKVMLQDRLFDRVKSKELVIFDSASRELESRKTRWEDYLKRAFKIGAEI